MKEQDKEIRRLKEENEFLEEASAFSQPAVGSQQKQRLMFIAIKTDDGRIKGKILLLQSTSCFQTGIQ